jgi:tetratricopeptide (TPR) repeat protein
LLLEVGVLRAMQGRDSEAVALYEETLARSPDHSVVLNNLAVLLAEVPERAAEALRHIDRAIAAVPSSADLLDSRALVLIGVGRPAEARDILERLCHSDRKNTRYRMHLAFALYHLNETDLSHDQIQKALQDGLEQEMLTPSERRLLRKITSNVTAKAP